MGKQKQDLTWELVKSYITAPFIWASFEIANVLDTIFNIIDWSVSYVARTFNVFFNIQWDENLNLWQNIWVNLYAPDSNGIPSMHTTLVGIAITLVVSSLGAEIIRFMTVPTYTFSTGFYATLSTLAIIIQLAFTNRENLKLQTNKTPGHDPDQGNYKPVPSPPMGKKKVPKKQK